MTSILNKMEPDLINSNGAQCSGIPEIITIKIEPMDYYLNGDSIEETSFVSEAAILSAYANPSEAPICPNYTIAPEPAVYPDYRPTETSHPYIFRNASQRRQDIINQQTHRPSSPEQDYTCQNCQDLMKLNSQLQLELHKLDFMLKKLSNKTELEMPKDILQRRMERLKLETKLKVAEVYNQGLESELNKVSLANQRLLFQMRCLPSQLEHMRLATSCFRLERFENNNEEINFYTGIPTAARLKCLYELVYYSQNFERSLLPQYLQECQQEKGVIPPYPPLSTLQQYVLLLDLKNQFFMTLVWLRLGLPIKDLSHRFGISEINVKEIISLCVRLLDTRLGMLNIWPSKQYTEQHQPEHLQKCEANVRAIFDIVKIQVLDHLENKINSLKGVVAITPNGHVCFVSRLFGEKVSDMDAVQESGLNRDLTGDDCVMTSTDLGVKLPFVKDLPLQNGENFQKFVTERIQQYKLFRIFDRPVNSDFAISPYVAYAVCTWLTNFAYQEDANLA